MYRILHSALPAPQLSCSGCIDWEQHSSEHSALAHSFDGALLLGDFAPVTSPDAINSATVGAIMGNENTGSTSLSDTGIDYRQLIAQLSIYFTLKMGDMIVVELGNSQSVLSPGDTATACLNGDLKLTIRVK